MYRLVTWRLPPAVVGEGGLAINAKAWEKLFKPVQEFVPDAPPALCDVIHQCLAFNAQQRPERASEVQGTLDHLADELVRTPEDRLEALEF